MQVFHEKITVEVFGKTNSGKGICIALMGELIKDKVGLATWHEPDRDEIDGSLAQGYLEKLFEMKGNYTIVYGVHFNEAQMVAALERCDVLINLTGLWPHQYLRIVADRFLKIQRLEKEEFSVLMPINFEDAVEPTPSLKNMWIDFKKIHTFESITFDPRRTYEKN